MHRTLIVASTASLALSSCGAKDSGPDAFATSKTAAIPERLAPLGDGYPSSGDPCRLLGESEAISDYRIYDNMILVGCPGGSTSVPKDGQVIGEVDGVVLVGISTDSGNRYPGKDGGDTLVPGTDYNATGPVKCGFNHAQPAQSCDAGVKRGRAKDGATLVEIRKPDGSMRAISFKATDPYEPFAVDSAQSAGSAGWNFRSTRSGDEVTVRFGPETYVINDDFVGGG